MLFPGSAKTPRNQRPSATWATLVSGGHVPPLHILLFSLSYLSFPFFNPYYFDEPTPPAVSMTESHTPCASRGPVDSTPRRSWILRSALPRWPRGTGRWISDRPSKPW